MENVIFIDRTTSNGKCTIYSSIELPLPWYSKDAITTYMGTIYKNLIVYHPTKKQVESIEKTHKLTTFSVGSFVV
jgi:hypothetical protein